MFFRGLQAQPEPVALALTPDGLSSYIVNNYEPTTPDVLSLSQVLGQSSDVALFAPIAWLGPGQLEYSIAKTNFKASKILQRGQGPVRIEENDVPFLAGQTNETIEPLAHYKIAKAAPVVVLKDRIVLLDGHHRVLASLSLGATHFPVLVHRNFFRPDLSIEEAEPLLRQAFLIWAFDQDDQPAPLPRFFDQMTSNPMIDWVSDNSLSLKFRRKAEDFVLDLKGNQWISHPLALRLKELPYPQLIKTSLLRRAGFESLHLNDGEIEERDHLELIRAAQRYLAEQLDRYPQISRLRLPAEIALPPPLLAEVPRLQDLEEWVQSQSTQNICRRLLDEFARPL